MLGVFGSGGMTLAIVIALIAYKRGGGGKLKLIRQDHHVFYWCAALSLASAGATEALRQANSVSATISTALTAQSGSIGSVGPAGVAAVLILAAFAFKPHFFKDVICGVAAPGILSAAGGIWALPVTILASLIHTAAS